MRAATADPVEVLIAKWRQNAKGISNSNFVKGMDYQAGVCADELESALRASRTAAKTTGRPIGHEESIHTLNSTNWEWLCSCGWKGSQLFEHWRDIRGASRTAGGGVEGLREAVKEAASDILKMTMEMIADPEGGIAIDQVEGLILGHIEPFLTLAASASPAAKESK